MIKIKAYDKLNKRWVEGGEVLFKLYSGSEGKYSVSINELGFDDGENRQSDFIVSQYIGKIDKNGKEIYIGDNVRILYTDWASKSSDDARTMEQYFNDISKVGVVCVDNLAEGAYIKIWGDKFKEHYKASIYCGKHGFIEVLSREKD